MPKIAELPNEPSKQEESEDVHEKNATTVIAQKV